MGERKHSGYRLTHRHDSVREQAEKHEQRARELHAKADELERQYDEVLADTSTRLEARLASLPPEATIKR